MPRYTALNLILWGKALKGDHKAFMAIHQSMRDAGLLRAEVEVEQPAFSQDDQLIIHDYIARIGATLPKKRRPNNQAKKGSPEMNILPTPQITRETANAICREDFYSFVRVMFPLVSTSGPLLPNWHIQAMAHSLDQVRRGKTTTHYHGTTEVPKVDLRVGCTPGIPARP